MGGSIYGSDGNDTIIIVGGSSLGGVADGGTGIDTLGFNNMGTINPDSIGSIYLNFENLGFFEGSTNLVGMWDFSSGNVTVLNGNLYVNGSLYTDLVTVNASGLLGGSGTIVTGLDRLLSDWLLAGLTLAYSDTDLTWDNSGHSGSMQGKHIGGYASIDIDRLFVDSSFSYADYHNGAARDITFAGGSAKVGSIFDSMALLGRIKGGYDFIFNDLLISPVVSIFFLRLHCCTGRRL